MSADVSMEKYIRIDRQTFEQLYKQLSPKLFRICIRDIGDMDEAAHIVQDVFLSLWERREGLLLENPEHYLCHAAKLKIINHYRDKQTRQSHLEIVAGSLSEADYGTEQALSLENLMDEIDTLLDRLPEKSKTVYRLHHESGLENPEIAVNLRMSESNVRQHMARARAFLRANLNR